MIGLLAVEENVTSQLEDLRSQTLGPQATEILSQIADAEENTVRALPGFHILYCIICLCERAWEKDSSLL